MLAAIREIVGPAEIALSVVSVMELEHGIWRAKEPARTRLRRQFLEDLIGNVPVCPITTEPQSGPLGCRATSQNAALCNSTVTIAV